MIVHFVEGQSHCVVLRLRYLFCLSLPRALKLPHTPRVKVKQQRFSLIMFYASRWSPYLPAQARHGKCKHTDKCTNKSYRTTATAVQQLYNPVAGRARSRRRSVDDTHFTMRSLSIHAPRPTSYSIRSSCPR